ncbi:SdpI family protein [Enterococcus gallinarum]|uniref:SdpI family protein n=1 Tax=Enterococcus gallinarum TaxID=1353 RepID=UPI001D1791C3|nr:SdpI family protein [Enterococcus gallinarum]MCC4044752.1 SdpI family protein [Enterococcus gallinarum]
METPIQWLIFWVICSILVFVAGFLDRSRLLGFRTSTTMYSQETWRYANTRGGLFSLICVSSEYFIIALFGQNSPFYERFFLVSVLSVLIIYFIVNQLTRKKFILKK